jgi:hypothetical protein
MLAFGSCLKQEPDLITQLNICNQKDRKEKMKSTWRFFIWFCICIIAGWSFAGEICADTLFKGRQIHLSKKDYRVFRIGVKGTTAGHNYVALVENAKQESISLGDLGFWELVPDHPSSLRNYDLQLIINNYYQGNFQIEFKYNKRRRDINYRIIEGDIQVKLDNSTYFPTLIIDRVGSTRKSLYVDLMGVDSSRLLFFDFNCLDIDLRKYYGCIQHFLKDQDSSVYFYYYESGNYDSYYFKTYQDVLELNTDKMGLSMEDGTLEYYQKVIDNLKSRFGSEFTGDVVIVTRFGNRFSQGLRSYANEIGVASDMEIVFWSYEDVKLILDSMGLGSPL